MKFGIVGLGLMGGSFAKVIKKYSISSSVVGYDHNENHKKQALELNLVEKVVDIDELLQCDVIVLCIPVDGIIKFMSTLEGIGENTTIIDFGSTKKLIVDNIPKSIKSNFIPAHPMTGTEKFGPSAAIDGLYEDKTIVLCDLDICGEVHKNRAVDIFKKIGMNIAMMDSTTHDIHACYMSHLPHAISFALATTVMSYEDPKNITSLAAGGFNDMSRIAKSSPDMWTDIFKQNRENLLESMEIYESEMKKLKNMLKDENYDEITCWMEKANTLHDIL